MWHIHISFGSPLFFGPHIPRNPGNLCHTKLFLGILKFSERFSWTDLDMASPFLSFPWVLPLVHGKKAFSAQLSLGVNDISDSPLFSSLALLPPVDNNSPSPGSADRSDIFWVVLLRQKDSHFFLMEKWESRQEFTHFFCLPWVLLCNWPGSWCLRRPRV